MIRWTDERRRKGIHEETWEETDTKRIQDKNREMWGVAPGYGSNPMNDPRVLKKILNFKYLFLYNR